MNLNLLDHVHLQYADFVEVRNISERDSELFQHQQAFANHAASQYALMHPRFYQHDTSNAYPWGLFSYLLGPDTVPNLHPLVQLGVIRRFKLPQELGIVAITHDWGEIHPDTGDDIYSEMPDADKKEYETRVRNEFIEELIPGGSSIVDLINDSLDPSTDLGAQFKISERIGYMRTILRAFKMLFDEIRAQNSTKRIEVLNSIASHGLFHIGPLEVASLGNPLILRFLEENASAISQIQDRYDKPNVPSTGNNNL